jgi:uncharacterized membrane protein
MTIGPVQMLVVGFENPEFDGSILRELDTLREGDAVRVIDLLAVRKDDAGEVQILQRSDLSLEEREELGAIVGALIGFGAAGLEGAELGAEAGLELSDEGHLLDPDDVWFAEEAIPAGSAAAIVLLEHRWAIGVRDAVRQSGGVLLSDAWIHPLDLVTVGLLAAEEARELVGPAATR